MLEWLVLAYRKMCMREWAVVWLSFLAINLVSLDLGMLIGIGVAALNFMLNYVQAPVMTPVCSREAQHIAKRTVVSRNLGPIVQFEFHGYLFFASVVKILEGVQKGVYVRKLGSVPNKQKYLPICASPHDSTVECLDGSPAPNTNILPTKYVVMGFTRVTGMDATAARGAFLILKKILQKPGNFSCVRECTSQNSQSAEEWSREQGEFLC
ncbi:hypothetical protein PC116_g7772 [Phytophthora cactorum]|uniref:Uncharacterized protein n=2 Tax=Phytophthora cactorum TaxID=29920 RepID=A0A329RX70_9STRA|nr:hypothetical protein PC112_g13336 [Phytophthora cactorum]KAG2819687.1 hypothetical protein PC111_g11782 [Phytophthora cactorum]KAG2899117.1 hypothetical protein PC114_g14006 [Phytophthora cactorum]KAG2930597.1 hypothetical protein PC117_g13689 [Phytophthora cactorum]KAG2976589.1 hypothetical protein PC118_g13349 [Phytophthora cactorum]